MNINIPTATMKNEGAGSAPFEVERMGARLGAEIHGLDLKQGLRSGNLQGLRGRADRAQGGLSCATSI